MKEKQQQQNPLKSRFSDLPPNQTDSLFASFKKFKESNSPNKINLSIGMLQDESGKYIEFDCVKQAEKALLSENLNKEYTVITGIPEYNETIKSIFFPNKENSAVKEDRILATQPVTGGAALRMASEIIKRFLPKKIHLSNLTFVPYIQIFEGLEICYYPYYNAKTKSLDLDAMKGYFNTLEPNSVVLFQLSSHNPTALDLEPQHWDELLTIFKSRNILLIFDAAYLGYAGGSFAADLYPIETYSQNRIEMLICYSSAKNFTNYCDDIGGLIVVLNRKENLLKLKSHIVVLARSLFSFPSLYGARVITKIYNNEKLKALWLQEQRNVFERIKEVREMVIQEMQQLAAKIDFEFLKEQKGIYMFLDLSEAQMDKLASEHLVFLACGGRVNLTGVNKGNMKVFVEAVKKVLEE
jgi:aspartate/tyrosine/aromatic aminotransferase